MKLSILEAKFLRIKETSPSIIFQVVDDLANAQGVEFLCPKCFSDNHGNVGTHQVICWFVGVPQTIPPTPGRWNATGTGLDALTFVGPGAYSVQLPEPCHWHGYVENGEANTR